MVVRGSGIAMTDKEVEEDIYHPWPVNKFGDVCDRNMLWKTPVMGGPVSKYWDFVTGGAIKGQVHMLVAPSGGGKTRTGIDVSARLLSAGWKVCYLTFEQTKEEIYEMMLIKLSGGDKSMAQSDKMWDKAKDLPFCVYEFDNNDKNSVIYLLSHFGSYDALVLDYVAPPDNCPMEGPEMSTTMRLMCKGIKAIATKNNQYVFCMAQGRDGEPDKDGNIAFSTVKDIWCSAQMITPLDVVCVQKSSPFGEKYLDFIKVRYPRHGLSRCRVVRRWDYGLLKSEDISIRDVMGVEINVKGLQGGEAGT